VLRDERKGKREKRKIKFDPVYIGVLFSLFSFLFSLSSFLFPLAPIRQ